MHFKLYVDNSTTPDIFDKHMTNMFSKKKKTTLQIDASKCTSLRFKTVMNLLPIINKHRESARKYLQQTTILVPNQFITRVINFSLPFVRPEQPVYINTLSKF